MLKNFKNSNFFYSRRHPKARRGIGEDPPGGGALLARPGSRARHQGAWGHLLASPFAHILLPDQNFLRRNPFLETYLCSAAVAITISGGDRRTCSGTLPEGEDHPGGLYIAMTTSRMMYE